MNFKTLAVAAAIVAAGTANAAISSFNGGTSNGNGSLVLMMLDSTGGTTQSLTVDLGLSFNDFASGGVYSKAGTSIIWDLANNTVMGSTRPDLSVAGTAISFTGTNDWASQLAIFKANSDAAETKWAVISGSQKGTAVNGFLTTAPVGGPTAAQLTQTSTTLISNMGGINASVITSLGNKGTITSADNGAFSAGATDGSYVGTGYGLSTTNGWKGNIKWASYALNGTSQSFEQVNANGTKAQVGQANIAGYFDAGTFTLQGDTLTYTVGVPEPESYALAIVGLLGMAAVARRRAAK
jgi:hypothetical protein